MKFILTIVTLLLASKSFAITLNNSAEAHFEEDEVKIHVAQGFCTEIGRSDDELLDMIQLGMDRYWNTVSSSRLTLTKGELKTVSSDFNTGSICSSKTGGVCTVNTALTVSEGILIACNTDPSNDNFEAPGSGVLAITIPNNVNGSRIIGSLILINDRSTNEFKTKSYDEQVAIIAHEVGHAIGIGHAKKSNNLMYFKSFSTRSGLGEDDWDSMTYLYPKEEPISGCGTIDLGSNPNSGPKGPFGPIIIVGFLLTLIPWNRLRSLSS